MSRCGIAAAVLVAVTVHSFEANAAAPKAQLSPWEFDWRHSSAWVAGASKPRATFAPAGCYVTVAVTVCNKTTLRREYICR
jgi:hypothetical protein